MGEIIISHLGSNNTYGETGLLQPVLCDLNAFHHLIILEGISGILFKQPGKIFFIQVKVLCHLRPCHTAVDVRLHIILRQTDPLFVLIHLQILLRLIEDTRLLLTVGKDPLLQCLIPLRTVCLDLRIIRLYCNPKVHPRIEKCRKLLPDLLPPLLRDLMRIHRHIHQIIFQVDLRDTGFYRHIL